MAELEVRFSDIRFITKLENAANSKTKFNMLVINLIVDY